MVGVATGQVPNCRGREACLGGHISGFTGDWALEGLVLGPEAAVGECRALSRWRH
jgi:hypothetical protein